MNETLKQYWNKVKEIYSKMPKQKKIIVAVSAMLIVSAMVAGVAAVKHDPYEYLYTELHEEDAKAIAKKLSEKNIPYHQSEDRRSVSVPKSRVHESRMELAKEGLPGQDVVGFEKFDGSTLGMSSYVQRIQYVRAVQGELTRSIQRLSAVKSARVHISIPPKKTFLEDEEPPKASVVLELKSGQTPSKQEMRGVAHLVASAVEGMKVSQVTIVDTKGNFLHRPEEESMGAVSSSLLEMQRQIENEYERRVEDMLTPVVGLGKVRAKVTAEIDPSRTNTTEETFDPDKVVARTISKNDEVTNGARPNPVGIPGSRSNLPGTENQNPGVPMATNNQEKNVSNTVNAIPRKIQVIDKPSGNIKRLTVAVVVDGYYKKGSTGAEAFTPRPEAELRRLQDLVANSVGFDTQRRDSITVSSLPFQVSENPLAEEAAPKGPIWQQLMEPGIRNALIGGVILLFFLLVVRPFTKWTLGATGSKKGKDLVGIPQTFPQTVAEFEKAVAERDSVGNVNAGLSVGGPSNPELPGAVEQAEVLMSSEEGSKDNKVPESIDKREQEELKQKILERLAKHPKKGIRIVQDWLEDQEPQAAEG